MKHVKYTDQLIVPYSEWNNLYTEKSEMIDELNIVKDEILLDNLFSQKQFWWLLAVGNYQPWKL